ncbi:MAG: S-adenosylmethionine decarboxylase [candidate division WWE3 bacterium]|nr:S-adenosylmethionine decarboxylase [candidate division WWE3 bacterium]
MLPPKINHLVAQAFDTAASAVSPESGRELVKKLDLTVVEEFNHPFEPQGFTQVFVLAESHLAIHAWPELGYLHFDLVTSSPESISADTFKSVISEIYQPQTIKVSVVNYE